MKELLLSVLEISLSTSLVILGLLLFSRLLNKRYVAKWKYYIWIALALRLVLPVKWELPQQKIVFEVPAQMAAPMAPIAGTVTAVLPQTPKTIAPLDILAALWLAGCVLFLLVHLGSYLLYRRQVMVYGQSSRELSSLCRSLSKELGISRPVPVRTYAKAGSPMVIGFFRPILVLPDMDYRQEALEFILRHELIHLKRHDIFWKLLFVAANALHWFNPIIYLMQKEAVVDMELSCDEQVIRHAGFENRKAYTETLLSTLSRQYTKTTKLSTEFYGGKEIMKKRFQNILQRTNKKNGLLILLATVALVAILGAAVSLSVADAETETAAGKPDNADNTGNAFQMMDSVPDSAVVEAGDVAVAFTKAVIDKDTDAMEVYLEDSYDGDLETYDSWNLALAPNLALTVIAGDGTYTEVGSGVTFSVPMEDKDQNMIVRLVLKETGWKVGGYYLEYASGEEESTSAFSDDYKELFELSHDFTFCFFNGIREGVEELLVQSYEGDIDVYTDYSDAELEGWSVSNEVEEGDKYKVGDVVSSSVVVVDSETGKTDAHLIFEAVKTDEGWKIQFYDLEE